MYSKNLINVPRKFGGPAGQSFPPTGPTGAAGAAGHAGDGSIIPFASGTPVALSTVWGGLLSTSSLFGFGLTLPCVSLIGSTVTVYTRMFQFTTPDDNFVEVPGAEVALAPALSGFSPSEIPSAELPPG